MALQNPHQAPIVDQGTELCKEAREALTMAIIGLCICGIILEPMAISKANEAKRKIAANPNLTGQGMANAATIIAVIGLILWVLGIIARVSQMGQV